MRTLIIAIAFLTGCASHSFHSKTVNDFEMTDTAAHAGEYESYSDSKTVTLSDYHVCLKQYAGMPDAQIFCTERMMAGIPGQLPLCGRSYVGYEIPGRTCRLEEIPVQVR